MTSSSFYEEGSKLLTPGAFEFVLDSELKRAVRSQNFLTLVVVEASREWEGLQVTADDGTLQEVAQLISREIRDTDLLGHTERGTLSLVLLDADYDHSSRVINRLVSRIENYEFPAPLRIAVGAAWVYLVAGEMLGARTGLGFLIVDARNFLRTDLILMAMVLIGAIGFVIDRAVAWLERRLDARWGLLPEEHP